MGSRTVMVFFATAIAIGGVGIGLLAMRPDPAQLMIDGGKRLESRVLGCDDPRLEPPSGDPEVVIIALNPDAPGAAQLCATAIQHLPIYWRITPQDACLRLVQHARREAEFHVDN